MRARVTGVLLKRLYVEGSDVKEGQPLFQIDPAPLKASLAAAEAALAQADANATNARLFAQRTRELKTTGAVSKSDVDTSEANELFHRGGRPTGDGEPANRAYQSQLRTGAGADFRADRANSG